MTRTITINLSRDLQNRMHLQKLVPLILRRIFTSGPSQINKVVIVTFLELKCEQKGTIHPSKSRSTNLTSGVACKHLKGVMESTLVPAIKDQQPKSANQWLENFLETKDIREETHRSRRIDKQNLFCK